MTGRRWDGRDLEHVRMVAHEDLCIGDLVLFAGCVLAVTERRSNGDIGAYHVHTRCGDTLIYDRARKWRVLGNVPEIAGSKEANT